VIDSQRIEAVWARFEAWLRATAPLIADDLRPPADEDALAAAEAHLRRALPEELKALLEIHDGGPGVFAGLDLMNTASIVWAHRHVSENASLDDVPEHLRWVLDAEGRAWWIPFASTAGGDYFCVDLAPGMGGTVGQVFRWNHDDVTGPPLAPSLAAWLARIVVSAEAGEVIYDAARETFLPFYGAFGFALAFEADPPMRFDAVRRKVPVRGPGSVALRSVETAGPLPAGLRIELVQAGEVVHAWDIDALRADEPPAVRFEVFIEEPEPWVPVASGTVLRVAGGTAEDIVWVAVDTEEATGLGPAWL
jgi:cell wall assembly regulator SMI1